jgi:hypothetical protein
MRTNRHSLVLGHFRAGKGYCLIRIAIRADEGVKGGWEGSYICWLSYWPLEAGNSN